MRMFYHNTDRDIVDFEPRPAFFSLTIEESVGYFTTWPDSRTLVVTATSDLRIADIATVEAFAKSIWPESDFLYSMFDMVVGEYPKEEVASFIKLFVDEGYDGAFLKDYSSDHSKDTTTVILFDPSKSVQVMYELKPIKRV